MSRSVPISCFLIVCNEADRLARTLNSIVGLVDEIVVVDSGSTDQTLKIAAQFGAKILHRDWTGFGAQKRFAEENCAHDWVLNLDADEVASQELVTQIQKLFEHGEPPYSGYQFRQVTVYPHQTKPRLWADYHNFIRLYDRREMRFADSPTHDAVEPKGKSIGQLSHPALHYSWRSLAHLAAKYDSYTDLQAKTLKRKSKILLAVRLITELPLNFFKMYFLRHHFTGGLHGLKAAAIIAYYRWRRIVKLLVR